MNLQIPQDTRRIILVSNVEQPPAFTFKDGDLVVEMNKAVHHDKLIAVLGAAPIKKFLFIRHNKKGHFFPQNFTEKSSTWDNIVMSSEHYGFASERWFADYSRATDGKTPTTGYGLYKFFRSRRPNMPIVGLGFNPDDHTTPHSPMHAWEYEWEQYRHDKHFQLHA